jgi:hypothetical protein
MSMDQTRIVGTGILFLCIFVSGVWLSKSGKPFNVIILTIHKLISLAAVVFLIITMYQINQVAELSATESIAGVVTGLLFLGAMISGGLLSIDKPMPGAILTMHRLTPFLTVFSTAVTLYLLLGRK